VALHNHFIIHLHVIEKLFTLFLIRPNFLEVAPKGVTVPLYAAIARSVLPNVDFSEHLVGPTGARKTAVTQGSRDQTGELHGGPPRHVE